MIGFEIIIPVPSVGKIAFACTMCTLNHLVVILFIYFFFLKMDMFLCFQRQSPASCHRKGRLKPNVPEVGNLQTHDVDYS